jgi:hypothetical protein
LEAEGCGIRGIFGGGCKADFVGSETIIRLRTSFNGNNGLANWIAVRGCFIIDRIQFGIHIGLVNGMQEQLNESHRNHFTYSSYHLDFTPRIK